MINVSRVIKNSKFAQSFIVNRQTGAWASGRWVPKDPILITMYGVVTAAGTKDIIQIPEGDRTSQIMVFHSTQELFVTHNEVGFEGTSDQIDWRGNKYRLNKVLQWGDFGYYKAFGVSMEGD